MRLATTLSFDGDARSERTLSRLEFAAALAIVIALHAALAVWILRSHEPPTIAPEPPRTIVARLLTAAPAAPLGPPSAPAAHPVEPPPPVPARAVAPPRPTPPAHLKPPVAPRPAVRHESPEVARETPAPSPTPAPAPLPLEPPAPAATAAPPAPAAPSPTATAAEATAQPSAARAAPKVVSHVDCNIAQPAYPAQSLRRNESGTAVVRFVVGVDGRVESAKIQQSSGYPRLDDAALGAVRGGNCRPWKEAGVPVRVAYAQPFVFGLR
ncbi:MAG TPA: energy transducer TonB [Paraburkholderia sp.]|jgi:protein TonB